jgi:type III secretion protein Y
MRDAVQLLHILGYLYGSHGQVNRGITYLLIAVQLSPDDPGLLRTLAHLLIRNGDAEKALATIDRMETMDVMASHPALALLKSRALLLSGRTEEARSSFQAFLAGSRNDARA